MLGILRKRYRLVLASLLGVGCGGLACQVGGQEFSAEAAESSPVAAEASAASTTTGSIHEQAALTREGNIHRGRQLFFDDARTKCASCHRVGDQGGVVGPELTQIGGKFDRPHLIESILEPSRQIVEGFRTRLLLLDDGRVLQGRVQSSSTEQVVVWDAAGVKHTLDRARVEEERDSELSLMPSGLAAALSPDEFTDIIAYLESLRSGAARMGAGVRGPVQLPAGYRIQTIATGLNAAVAMEVMPDGRLLICEQAGSLRIIRDGQLLPEPMVTIPVHLQWERGLLGVTLDPQFPAEPYVYVCYVSGQPFIHHVISRFRVAGDVVQAGSEQILLEGDDQSLLGGKVPAGHQGGALHFGPDGCLYIGLGEQTAGLPAQALDTFQGKLLRIHRDGAIPADNPLLDRTRGKYRAIWAYGLRNPFTFAIDRTDSRLLINDVGGAFEEINRGMAGVNYGWPIVEHGAAAPTGVMAPIYTYPQASIAGGDFIPKDSSWPRELWGHYLFADFVHGWIHRLAWPAAASGEVMPEAFPFAEGLRRPVDMRFGPNGRLFVLLRNAWVADDKLLNGTSSVVAIDYVPE